MDITWKYHSNHSKIILREINRGEETTISSEKALIDLRHPYEENQDEIRKVENYQ